MSDTPYRAQIYDAADVCINCFLRTRVERIDPIRGGLGGEFEAHLERHRRHTEVAYGPADCVSEQKGVFCECGVEGSHTRTWDDGDVDRDRFRRFIKNALRSLASKGVDVNRRVFADVALSQYDANESVDTCFEEATTAGIASSVATDTTPKKAKAE